MISDLKTVIHVIDEDDHDDDKWCFLIQRCIPLCPTKTVLY